MTRDDLMTLEKEIVWQDHIGDVLIFSDRAEVIIGPAYDEEFFLRDLLNHGPIVDIKLHEDGRLNAQDPFLSREIL